MLIQCLIRREGPTHFTLGKTKYMCMPIPGARKGEMVTSVVDIANDEHVAYLLHTKQYREWREEYGVEDLRALREQKNPLLGFSVEKAGSGENAGYLAVDRRGAVVLFAGTAGQWRKDTPGLVPFSTEREAFEFLTEEAHFAEQQDEPAGQGPTFMPAEDGSRKTAKATAVRG